MIGKGRNRKAKNHPDADEKKTSQTKTTYDTSSHSTTYDIPGKPPRKCQSVQPSKRQSVQSVEASKCPVVEASKLSSAEHGKKKEKAQSLERVVLDISSGAAVTSIGGIV